MAGTMGTEVLYKKESHMGMTTLTFRSKRYTFPSVIVKSDLKSEGMCVMLDVGMFCPFCAGTYRAKLVSSKARLAITKSSSYEEAMRRLDSMSSDESCDSHVHSSCDSHVNSSCDSHINSSCDSHVNSPCDSHSTSAGSPEQHSGSYRSSQRATHTRGPDRDTFEDKVAKFECTLQEMQSKDCTSEHTGHKTETAPSRQGKQNGTFTGKVPNTDDNSDGKRSLLVETKEAQLSFRHDKISKCGEHQQKETFQLPQQVSSKDKAAKTLLYRDPHIPAPELLLRGKLCERGMMPTGECQVSPVVPRKQTPHKAEEEEEAKQDTEIITEVKLNNQKNVAQLTGDRVLSDEDVTLELKHVTNLDKGMCTTRAIKSVPVELFVSDEHSLSSSPVVEGSVMSDYGSLDVINHDTSSGSLDNLSSSDDVHHRYGLMKKTFSAKPRAIDKIISEEDRTKHGSLETLKPIQTKADEACWSSEDLHGFKMEVHHPISLHRYAGRAFKPIKRTKKQTKDTSTQTMENFDSIQNLRRLDEEMMGSSEERESFENAINIANQALHDIEVEQRDHTPVGTLVPGREVDMSHLSSTEALDTSHLSSTEALDIIIDDLTTGRISRKKLERSAAVVEEHPDKLPEAQLSAVISETDIGKLQQMIEQLPVDDGRSRPVQQESQADMREAVQSTVIEDEKNYTGTGHAVESSISQKLPDTQIEEILVANDEKYLPDSHQNGAYQEVASSEISEHQVMEESTIDSGVVLNSSRSQIVFGDSISLQVEKFLNVESHSQDSQPKVIDCKIKEISKFHVEESLTDSHTDTISLDQPENHGSETSTLNMDAPSSSLNFHSAPNNSISQALPHDKNRDLPGNDLHKDLISSKLSQNVPVSQTLPLNETEEKSNISEAALGIREDSMSPKLPDGQIGEIPTLHVEACSTDSQSHGESDTQDEAPPGGEKKQESKLEHSYSTESGDSTISESYSYQRFYDDDSDYMYSSLDIQTVKASKQEGKDTLPDTTQLISSSSNSSVQHTDGSDEVFDDDDTKKEKQERTSESDSSDEDSGGAFSPFSPEDDVDDVLENVETMNFSADETISRAFALSKYRKALIRSETEESGDGEIRRDLSPETILDEVLEDAKDLDATFIELTSDYGSEQRTPTLSEDYDQIEEDFAEEKKVTRVKISGRSSRDSSSKPRYQRPGNLKQSEETFDKVTFYLSESGDSASSSMEKIIDDHHTLTENIPGAFGDGGGDREQVDTPEQVVSGDVEAHRINSMQVAQLVGERLIELETIEEHPEYDYVSDATDRRTSEGGTSQTSTEVPSVSTDVDSLHDYEEVMDVSFHTKGSLQKSTDTLTEHQQSNNDLMSKEVNVITDQKYLKECMINRDEPSMIDSDGSKGTEDLNDAIVHDSYDAIKILSWKKGKKIDEAFYEDTATIEEGYCIDRVVQTENTGIPLACDQQGDSIIRQSPGRKRVQQPDDGKQKQSSLETKKAAIDALDNLLSNITQMQSDSSFDGAYDSKSSDGNISDDMGLTPERDTDTQPRQKKYHETKPQEDWTHFVAGAAADEIEFHSAESFSKEQAQEFMQCMLASHAHQHHNGHSFTEASAEDGEPKSAQTAEELSARFSEICNASSAEGEISQDAQEQVVSEEITTQEVTLIFVWPKKKGAPPVATGKNGEPYRELHMRRITRLNNLDNQIIEGPTVSSITRPSDEAEKEEDTPPKVQQEKAVSSGDISVKSRSEKKLASACQETPVRPERITGQTDQDVLAHTASSKSQKLQTQKSNIPCQESSVNVSPKKDVTSVNKDIPVRTAGSAGGSEKEVIIEHTNESERHRSTSPSPCRPVKGPSTKESAMGDMDIPVKPARPIQEVKKVQRQQKPPIPSKPISFQDRKVMGHSKKQLTNVVEDTVVKPTGATEANGNVLIELSSKSVKVEEETPANTSNPTIHSKHRTEKDESKEVAGEIKETPVNRARPRHEGEDHVLNKSPIEPPKVQKHKPAVPSKPTVHSRNIIAKDQSVNKVATIPKAVTMEMTRPIRAGKEAVPPEASSQYSKVQQQQATIHSETTSSSKDRTAKGQSPPSVKDEEPSFVKPSIKFPKVQEQIPSIPSLDRTVKCQSQSITLMDIPTSSGDSVDGVEEEVLVDTSANKSVKDALAIFERNNSTDAHKTTGQQRCKGNTNKATNYTGLPMFKSNVASIVEKEEIRETDEQGISVSTAIIHGARQDSGSEGMVTKQDVQLVESRGDMSSAEPGNSKSTQQGSGSELDTEIKTISDKEEQCILSKSNLTSRTDTIVATSSQSQSHLLNSKVKVSQESKQESIEQGVDVNAGKRDKTAGVESQESQGDITSVDTHIQLQSTGSHPDLHQHVAALDGVSPVSNSAGDSQNLKRDSCVAGSSGLQYRGGEIDDLLPDDADLTQDVNLAGELSITNVQQHACADEPPTACNNARDASKHVEDSELSSQALPVSEQALYPPQALPNLGDPACHEVSVDTVILHDTPIPPQGKDTASSQEALAAIHAPHQAETMGTLGEAACHKVSVDAAIASDAYIPQRDPHHGAALYPTQALPNLGDPACHEVSVDTVILHDTPIPPHGKDTASSQEALAAIHAPHQAETMGTLGEAACHKVSVDAAIATDAYIPQQDPAVVVQGKDTASSQVLHPVGAVEPPVDGDSVQVSPGLAQLVDLPQSQSVHLDQACLLSSGTTHGTNVVLLDTDAASNSSSFPANDKENLNASSQSNLVSSLLALSDSVESLSDEESAKIISFGDRFDASATVTPADVEPGDAKVRSNFLEDILDECIRVALEFLEESGEEAVSDGSTPVRTTKQPLCRAALHKYAERLVGDAFARAMLQLYSVKLDGYESPTEGEADRDQAKHAQQTTQHPVQGKKYLSCDDKDDTYSIEAASILESELPTAVDTKVRAHTEYRSDWHGNDFITCTSQQSPVSDPDGDNGTESWEDSYQVEYDADVSGHYYTDAPRLAFCAFQTIYEEDEDNLEDSYGVSSSTNASNQNKDTLGVCDPVKGSSVAGFVAHAEQDVVQRVCLDARLQFSSPVVVEGSSDSLEDSTTGEDSVDCMPSSSDLSLSRSTSTASSESLSGAGRKHLSVSEPNLRGRLSPRQKFEALRSALESRYHVSEDDLVYQTFRTMKRGYDDILNEVKMLRKDVREEKARRELIFREDLAHIHSDRFEYRSVFCNKSTSWPQLCGVKSSPRKPATLTLSHERSLFLSALNLMGYCGRERRRLQQYETCLKSSREDCSSHGAQDSTKRKFIPVRRRSAPAASDPSGRYSPEHGPQSIDRAARRLTSTRSRSLDDTHRSPRRKAHRSRKHKTYFV